LREPAGIAQQRESKSNEPKLEIAFFAASCGGD
jgi:hypothetical protein